MREQKRVFSDSPYLNVMCNAATRAAKSLVRDFGEVENLQVSRKGPGDFVSTADRNAEEIIFDALKNARPTYGFMMEESGEIEGDSEFRWIIDPLDGTTNFLHGIPHFSISIALQKGKDIIAGVVYDPIKDEMFTAEKGAGSFMNNKRLRVSSRKDLSQSLLATGIPFASHTPEEMVCFQKSLSAIMPRVSGVHRMGSAALDLAYVAAGRYDAYWERGLQPWDMAAGILLVKEAGGYVYDLNDKENMLDNGSVLAANTSLYAPLRDLLKPCYSE